MEAVGCAAQEDDFIASLRESFALGQWAEGVLGLRAWRLLSSYGRLMHGPLCGRYVSGAPFDAQREIVLQLTAGKSVPVHLMHRHVSGQYEASQLRWSEGALVMVFADREERA